MNSRARLATAAAAAAALGVTALTGCSNGPLDTKCEEFLTLSASAQRDIVLAWEKDNNFGDGEMGELRADQDLPAMVEYCQGDPDAKISELEYSFG